MVRSIILVEDQFYSDLRYGTKYGLRILDHGVCSGLLALQLVTRTTLLACVPKPNASDSGDHKAWEDMTSALSGLGDVTTWWREALWGTCAAAIHNIAQQENTLKLDLKTDSIAYLGALVDVLQVWDRSTTSRRGAFRRDDLPIQRLDVELKADRLEPNTDGMIRMKSGRGKSLSKKLDEALEDWSKIVRVS